MFSIQTDLFAGLTRYRLRNEDSGEYLAVLPAAGGVLQELVLAQEGRLFSIVDGVTADELPGNMWYKSALLFPFAGRIRNGAYTFEGRAYQLPVNELVRQAALHGLVADKPFQVVRAEQGRNHVSLQLGYEYNGHLAGYPFPFVLQVTYVLLANHRFRMDVEARNTGPDRLPMGFGWHPYFRTGGVVDQLRLALPSRKYHETDPSLIPTGTVAQMSGFTLPALRKGGGRIGGTQLDHAFVGGRYAALADTLLHDPARQLTIRLHQWRRQGFEYTQVFTPSHRDSIALEPQTCLSDAFNNGLGLKILAPGETWTGTVGVGLE